MTRQFHDVDYGARTYYIKTKKGPKGIQHGSGPLWGFGTPFEKDIWSSVRYDEATYDVAGVIIIDARGQLPNGSWWRSVGKFGESASYSDVDEATAKILDQLLDGACLEPKR